MSRYFLAICALLVMLTTGLASAAPSAKLTVNEDFTATLNVDPEGAGECFLNQLCGATSCPGYPYKVDCAASACGPVRLDVFPAAAAAVAVVRIADGVPLFCGNQPVKVEVEIKKSALEAQARSRGEQWWFPAGIGTLQKCNDGPCASPVIVQAGTDGKSMTIAFSTTDAAGKTGKHTVSVPVSECGYVFSSYPLGGLVLGARQQLGKLVTESGSACQSALVRVSLLGGIEPSHSSIRLRSGSVDIQGEHLGEGVVRLSSIPEQLALEEQTFELVKDGSAIGKLRARVVKGLSADPKALEVTYNDPELDALHDKKSESVAIVSLEGREITNRTPVRFGSEVSGPGSWKTCGQSEPVASHRVLVGASGLPEFVEFAVKRQALQPIEVGLCFFEKPIKTEEKRKTSDEVEILRVVGAVATSAVSQSLPLPLSGVVNVDIECQDEELVSDRGPVVIPNGSMTGNSCKLTLGCDDSTQAEKLCGASGLQVVRIETSDQTGHRAASHPIWDPTTELKVEVPIAGDFEKDAIYDLVVSIPRKSTPGVTYRTGSASTLQDGDVVTERRFAVRMQLVDRGPTALGNIARYYFTVPVNLTGFRFPADPRNVEKSSDSSYFEILAPRAGLLFTIEPWDFRYRKNSLSVPLRLQGGVLFLGTGTELDETDVFSEFGLSLEVPLFNAPKDLGSSVAVSVMWEHDLSSAARQDHFFTTYLGLNFFKFLSSQAASD